MQGESSASLGVAPRKFLAEPELPPLSPLASLAEVKPLMIPRQRIPETQSTPVLDVELGIVGSQYLALCEALPGVRHFYAVKANPAPPVLRRLAGLGANFDVASAGEIMACLQAGISAERMSFGNTIKRVCDIQFAARLGIDAFTFDSPGELEKLIEHAPGSLLMVRIVTSGAGADWSLSAKFGTDLASALALLRRAGLAGHRLGVAFHVGSQQRLTTAWDEPIAHARWLHQELADVGLGLTMVNLGGGFPASMLEQTEPLAAYGQAINDALDTHFAGTDVQFMAEPGRVLVADSGTLDTEVLLVAERGGTQWAYLDVGLFGGLAEALGEAIRYRLTVLRAGQALVSDDTRPMILAGPTCDSVDVLYRDFQYELPRDLRAGDVLRFHATGAYTTTYASVGFNGFEPLRETYS